MSQDPNQNNNIEEIEDGTEIITRTNEILENINRTFRMNARSRQINALIEDLNPENPINQRIIENSNNLDRALRQRSRLREELQTTRCNYLISAQRFCTRRKTSGSDYCVYHTNEFNGVNYGMVGRPRRQINRSPRRVRSFDFIHRNQNSSSSDLPNLDISSSSNLQDLNLPNLNLPNLDISSSSNLQDLNTTSISSSNPNVSIEISNPNPNVEIDISYSRDLRNLDPDFNPNLNRRVRFADLPALPPILRRSFRIPSAVSLGVTGNNNDDDNNVALGVSSPEINLFNLISRVRRSTDNLAELKKNKDKNGKCCLCKKTVHDPKVILKCDHKYHLKCYMILNTDSDNKYEIMEKCMECEKPVDLNIPEEKDCSICLEKLIDDDIEIELPCKHRFHIYCIQRWVDINKNCPLCRKTF